MSRFGNKTFARGARADEGCLLVTGGCGFIGSAFIRWVLLNTQVRIVNLDVLTCVAQPRSLSKERDSNRYTFVKGDIADSAIVTALLGDHQPKVLVNFAAESHVDRSITGPSAFARTNIQGTLNLLECSRSWLQEAATDRGSFRFLQISTDEVYGDLGAEGSASVEGDPWRPGSPYAASKAAADHLVGAWHRTYGFPVIVSHASNNYGPWQYPEKLIPLVIKCAMRGEAIPIYGTGEQVRDWLHVDDHVRALWLLLQRGEMGQHYNIGGRQPRRNIDLVRDICKLLDEFSPDTAPAAGHFSLIRHVEDRAGHDWRYALNACKMESLGWKPLIPFSEGLRETVRFYVECFRE